MWRVYPTSKQTHSFEGGSYVLCQVMGSYHPVLWQTKWRKLGWSRMGVDWSWFIMNCLVENSWVQNLIGTNPGHKNEGKCTWFNMWNMGNHWITIHQSVPPLLLLNPLVLVFKYPSVAILGCWSRQKTQYFHPAFPNCFITFHHWPSLLHHIIVPPSWSGELSGSGLILGKLIPVMTNLRTIP